MSQPNQPDDPGEPDRTIRTSPEHPEHEQELLDEALQETFPASDPVSITIDRPPDEAGARAGKSSSTSSDKNF
jgi:hypothetical protein